MLHILALAYFVALLSVAIVVIAGMLFANRDHILGALGLDQPPAVHLRTLAVRPRSRARVIRMASPTLALRMAA